MSNNAHWNRDFGFSGPHATFHYQNFQMVDLIKLHYKRAMNGLNPRALPYEPTENSTNHVEKINLPSKVKK